MAFLRITAPDEYQGSQYIFSSGRIILNSVASPSSSGDMFLVAAGTLALGANEMHLNSKNDMFFNVSGSNKMIFGKPNSERPKIQANLLGASTYEFLDDILSLISTLKIHTPMGTAVIAQESIDKLLDLQKKYLQPTSNQYILSDLVFTADNIQPKNAN